MAADKVLTFRDGGSLVISSERVNPVHLTDDEQQLVRVVSAGPFHDLAEVREFPKAGER